MLGPGRAVVVERDAVVDGAHRRRVAVGVARRRRPPGGVSEQGHDPVHVAGVDALGVAVDERLDLVDDPPPGATLPVERGPGAGAGATPLVLPGRARRRPCDGLKEATCPIPSTRSAPRRSRRGDGRAGDTGASVEQAQVRVDHARRAGQGRRCSRTRPGDPVERQGPPDHRARAGARGWSRPMVDAKGTVVEWTRGRRRPPGAAVRGRRSGHPRPQGRPAVAGGHARAGHHRLRAGSRSTRGPPATSASRSRTAGGSSRCISFYREEPADNGYARPIEGVVAFVDGARGEVLEVVDHGVVPLPPEPGSYYPEDNQPAPRRPPRAARSSSRTVRASRSTATSCAGSAGRCGCRWTRYEGLVLHTVGYDDGGRRRPILHRASICEMVVPYGDPGPMHGWKNAFDAGEWGLGRMANSLALGCDCLGEIHYLDAVVLPREQRRALRRSRTPSASTRRTTGSSGSTTTCTAGATEVRRSRRLVVVVDRHRRQLRVRLLLVLLPRRHASSSRSSSPGSCPPRPSPPGEHARVRRRWSRPACTRRCHQHLFCARLDLDVDGTVNEVVRGRGRDRARPGPTTRGATPSSPRADPLDDRAGRAARHRPAPAAATGGSSTRHVRNGLGRAGRLQARPRRRPRRCSPPPTSSVGRRAAFARHNLWVTPYRPDERRAAGDYPNQHAGGDGLPRWTAADRSLVDTDVVALVHVRRHPPRPAPRTGR